MAQKPDVQYIRFYTDGSAARKLEINPPRRKSKLPKPRKRKQRVIQVDPLALGGILVSVVMLVLMLVGTAQLYAAHEQVEQLENSIQILQERNVHLHQEYEAGYDLKTIEDAALAMGMIPVEQATTIVIPIEVPVVVEEATAWDHIVMFLQGIFA